MLSSINFWMCFAGLIYLVAGVFILRKDINAARGWDKLITLGCIFIAVPLAVFAPEHFGGPMGVADMVPSWMPAHLFSAYFVGCALLAAAASLTVRKFVGLSSTLLGLMFFLFVCMIHIPNALAHPKDRFAWAVALRDLSFAGGAWALAGLHSRARSPQQSKWMILFGRIVLAMRCDLFRRRTFSSSRVCARRSFGKDDAIMGSIPQPMGIPRRSDPAGRWNRLGPEQKISDSRNLDWRINDRPHSIPISAHFDPRPRPINARDQRSIKLRRGHVALRRSSAVLASALPRDPRRVI
jgi:hypothetical protein